MSEDTFSAFMLPLNVVSRADVNRLYREAELIENFLRQDEVRQPGVQPKMPSTSRALDELCKANNLNILQGDDRVKILGFLRNLKKQAPVLHISFAVEASPAFIAKITAWVRQNLDNHVLILVGCAPAIKAGCIVRTTNKSYDFGLKKRFEENRSLLLERVRTLG